MAGKTTKECVTCASHIPLKALKCTECDGYQDWRRYVIDWTGVVTALLVLVPVWSGAIYLWGIAVRDPADIRLSVFACERSVASLAISNLGGEPAIVSSLHASVTKEDAAPTELVTFWRAEPDLPIILGPKEIKPIKLTATQLKSFPFSTDGLAKCVIQISVAVDGDSKRPSGECGCPLDQG